MWRNRESKGLLGLSSPREVDAESFFDTVARANICAGAVVRISKLHELIVIQYHN